MKPITKRKRLRPALNVAAKCLNSNNSSGKRRRSRRANQTATTW
jgi:hypothetical protein